MDTASLEQALATLPLDGPWTAIRTFARAARANFDSAAACRLALVVERNQTKLPALVANAPRHACQKSAQRLADAGRRFLRLWRPLPARLPCSSPARERSTPACSVIWPAAFPQALDTLTLADDGFGAPDGVRLSDLIYPATAFDDATRERQDAALRATQVAQPAIGAVSLAALKILASFNVLPQAVAGHSYGELTALCAAGCYDETVFGRLSRLRGALMAEGTGDRGGMLAVSAPLATVEQILAETGLDLVIANRNAPLQAVLSGASAEISRAVEIFTARGLNVKQLPVAAAFHSSLVADAAAPFLGALKDVEFGAGRIPVYANSTAAIYPADPAGGPKRCWATSWPNRWNSWPRSRPCTPPEAAPSWKPAPVAVLTGLVSSILGDREHVALALDASAGKRSGMGDSGPRPGPLGLPGIRRGSGLLGRRLPSRNRQRQKTGPDHPHLWRQLCQTERKAARDGPAALRNRRNYDDKPRK